MACRAGATPDAACWLADLAEESNGVMGILRLARKAQALGCTGEPTLAAAPPGAFRDAGDGADGADGDGWTAPQRRYLRFVRYLRTTGRIGEGAE
jgi:hypothetical protein